MKISFTYLNHYFEIELPDPEEENNIYVSLWRAKETYDPDLYNAYLTDYQFSATSPDPNQWLTEAISSAISTLAGWGIKYHDLPPTPTSTPNNSDDDNSDYDIPF